jgi:glycosyltransferase involved in cell wall biosynthesis
MGTFGALASASDDSPRITRGPGIPSLSVVIPALNEAHHLRELLPEIMSQSVLPVEVIVADAGSSDSTPLIAEEHGARVVTGGRPALGRNNGARAARGDWVCFLDADTRLPRQTTLEDAVVGALRGGVTAIVGDYRPYYRPGDLGFRQRLVRLYDRVLMRVMSASQRAWLRTGFPVGQAVFLLTSREAFLSLGGFSAAAEPFEDSEYLLRVHRRCPAPAGRASAVGVMPRNFHVWVSTRRWDVLGRVRFPVFLGVRGGILRRLLRRELPDPSYWELNARGLYRECQQTTSAALRRT